MPTMGTGGESHQEIPLSRIVEMQRQGLTNNQIIQTLQRDGYSSTQIFDALNQANMQPTQQTGAIPVHPDNFTVNQSPLPGDPAPMPPPPQAAPPPAMPQSGPTNEELIEAIIDEKWADLMKSVEKIVEWKEAMTSKIEKLEQRFEDVKAEFDKLHEAVIGKIGEYDKNILTVGAEVKAMEKVFSKVLPVFTENVAELSRVAETIKSAKPKVTSKEG